MAKMSDIVLAYKNKKYETVEQLLENCDINERDTLRNTNFVEMVCKRNDMKFFNLILDKNPNFDGAVIDVCENGNMEMMKAIMQKIKNMQIINQLLVIVCRNNYHDIAELILGYCNGNENFLSIFSEAIINESFSIAEMLLEKFQFKIDQFLIHRCCISGTLKALKYALKFNTNVNLCDKDGFTALRYACMQKQSRIVKFLIDNGALIEDDFIIIASFNSDFETIKLLISKGIDVNFERKPQIEDEFDYRNYRIEKNCRTALVACLRSENYSEEIYNFLVDNGADTTTEYAKINIAYKFRMKP